LPVTLYVPELSAIAPAELVPSPQLIIAEYAPINCAGPGSVNVATTTLPLAVPSLPAMTNAPVPTRSGNATTAVLVATALGAATELVLCAIVTVIGNDAEVA